MSTKAKSKLCFVIGPIGADESDVRIHADWLLEEIIEPVMAQAQFSEFRVERSDKLPAPGLIDAQIIDRLLGAQLVIADLSFLNPIDFYEIGIRHMEQKPIIYMQLSDQELPFDVSSYRAIKFSRKKPRDLKDARDALQAQVATVLRLILKNITRSHGTQRSGSTHRRIDVSTVSGIVSRCLTFLVLFRLGGIDHRIGRSA
jgi:hypothetical protein